jgi:hypothetical protein
MNSAYRFFREHAGYRVGFSAVGAIALARAEQQAESEGWTQQLAGPLLARGCSRVVRRGLGEERIMSNARKNQNRSAGRFDKLNPCEGCGKSAGESYFSDSRCNTLGVAVVLCEACATKAETMTTEALVAWMNDAHLPACTDTDCAEGCPVQAKRDAEYAAGHEWHG